MLTSEERFQAIYGLLLGIAIGDALGFPRDGLSYRTAIRIYGRRPLRFRLWPGEALYSDETQLALMCGQSILQSRSTSEIFHDNFARRLRWYVLSLPIGLSRGVLVGGLRAWFRWFGVPGGSGAHDNSPGTRSMLLGVALHRTGHRYSVWARDTAAITHKDPLVIDAAAVLAAAAQIAAVAPVKQLNVKAAMETIIRAAKEPELRSALEQIAVFLEEKKTARKVAAHFGWQKGIKAQALPTTVMAIYCFMRYSSNIRHAFKAALLLGGNTCTLAALVGGLSGAHIGIHELPKSMAENMADWPQTTRWIERMSIRLAAWPHGVDDLLYAPALPSYPIAQLLRNFFRWPLILVHRLIRLVFWLLRSVI